MEIEKKIRVYQTEDGRSPFNDWLFKLRDKRGKFEVLERIRRLRLGNWGLWKRLETIYELKVDVGPGYRVYLGDTKKQ